MTDDVLKKIEELMNEYDDIEDMWINEGNQEMVEWAINHKMGLYDLLREFDYDCTRDVRGKIKVIGM